MIGKICIFVSPFYDNVKKQNSFKARPCLVIGIADAGDYNVLPVSKVTNRKNIDSDYDIPIDPYNYPKLKLNDPSYVRVLS